ncbi:unnamed protein product [Symbiodinium natans]|uniref:Uncharacterized protein n=1 Tax=Symbiodinium natans TaxID=878477 RepID=A0A812KMX9_9DINO|nr:unnamed protein product [Symbiodinium natans]
MLLCAPTVICMTTADSLHLSIFVSHARASTYRVEQISSAVVIMVKCLRKKPSCNFPAHDSETEPYNEAIFQGDSRLSMEIHALYQKWPGLDSFEREDAIKLLTQDGLLPTWEGATCPFCFKGIVALYRTEIQDFPDIGADERKNCHKFITPQYLHPLFAATRGPEMHSLGLQAGVLLLLLAGVAASVILLVTQAECPGKIVEWEQWVGLVQRGKPTLLVLLRLSPKPTNKRAPGPGPIRKNEWRTIVNKAEGQAGASSQRQRQGTHDQSSRRSPWLRRPSDKTDKGSWCLEVEKANLHEAQEDYPAWWSQDHCQGWYAHHRPVLEVREGAA